MTTYAFESTWAFDDPPEPVFEVLVALPAYPRWWPEVRHVERIDDDAARLVVRSTLPYSLTFVIRREMVDRDAGIIAASMTGDLIGRSRWVLARAGTGTVVTFTEEATIGKPSLLRLEPALRPAFRWNHAQMMRSAERGLRAAVAGARVAHELSVDDPAAEPEG